MHSLEHSPKLMCHFI